MGQAGGAVGGGVACLAVALLVAAPQLLAQILADLHQIAAIEHKASPVFRHPQALPGPIQVGVEQTQQLHPGCRCRVRGRKGQAALVQRSPLFSLQPTPS